MKIHTGAWILGFAAGVFAVAAAGAQHAGEESADDMLAVEDYQADLAAALPPPPDAAAEEVWWGNRAVSYRNYIPVEAPPCEGECGYCDRNMICCATGCPCVHCQYICDDCSDCPPLTFDRIFFDLDRSVLRPESKEELDKVVAYLAVNPDRMVLVEGHCCDLGSDGYNLDLGRRRAEAVKRYLAGHGVAPGRILTQSYGERRPWVEMEQRPLNRRAVIIVLPEGAV